MYFLLFSFSFHRTLLNSKAESILIVGGNIRAVELAADLSEFRPQKRITLVTSEDSLIPSLEFVSLFLLIRCSHTSRPCDEWIRHWLKDHSVRVVLGEEVLMADVRSLKRSASTSSDDKVSSDEDSFDSSATSRGRSSPFVGPAHRDSLAAPGSSEVESGFEFTLKYSRGVLRPDKVLTLHLFFLLLHIWCCLSISL